jgi:hypothetical protein
MGFCVFRGARSGVGFLGTCFIACPSEKGADGKRQWGRRARQWLNGQVVEQLDKAEQKGEGRAARRNLVGQEKGRSLWSRQGLRGNCYYIVLSICSVYHTRYIQKLYIASLLYNFCMSCALRGLVLFSPLPFFRSWP